MDVFWGNGQNVIQIIRLSLDLRSELSLLFIGESQKRQSGDVGKCRSVVTNIPVCFDFLHQIGCEGPFWEMQEFLGTMKTHMEGKY